MLLRFCRRALTATALAGVAAAGLTACGGSSHAATARPAAAASAGTDAPAAAGHTEAADPAAAEPTDTAAQPEHHTPMGSDAAAAPVATSAVTIENFGFSPAAITVKAGTTVTWTNRDDEPHSVVSSDEPMRSPTLAGQNNTFSHTFAKPGRYAYNCGIHPFMHGTVEVTA